ncbi:efflux RND transporter permease subunit [Algoriphagus ratkowskyi]|uniref:efflux RND transporter permease subunit n=1 Tax=Algoriphagus ratkowskyi TaxID=57028 RepID=UPI0021CD457C|nr:efflux RND transporter permease subunit [Algoriphagus ratkowskyi]
MLGLIPLALKGGELGNEIQSLMAVVILGGLLTAALLNLIVIPCVYELVLKREDRQLITKINAPLEMQRGIF